MAAPENNVRELTLKRQEMKSKKRYCLEDDKKVNHRVVIFIVEPGMSRQETFRHASQLLQEPILRETLGGVTTLPLHCHQGLLTMKQ